MTSRERIREALIVPLFWSITSALYGTIFLGAVLALGRKFLSFWWYALIFSVWAQVVYLYLIERWVLDYLYRTPGYKPPAEPLRVIMSDNDGRTLHLGRLPNFGDDNMRHFAQEVVIAKMPMTFENFGRSGRIFSRPQWAKMRGAMLSAGYARLDKSGTIVLTRRGAELLREMVNSGE